MEKISVVMITRNEAEKIERTLRQVLRFSDDVVVADTGSTDETISMAREAGAKVVQINWQGFGKSKNEALLFAKNDWIFFPDADEVPDDQLVNALVRFSESDPEAVYDVKFINYLGNAPMQHGEWNYRKIRLFNKTRTRWDESPIHEKLIRSPHSRVVPLPGFIHHYSLNDESHFLEKTKTYADLMARKYFEQGRKSSWFKRRLYPQFQFFKNYYLRGGYKDGAAGKTAASMSAHYAFLKYDQLNDLWREKKPE